MALDVIGIGYGRTGTETLRAALNILGFGPCHHMHVMRDQPDTFPVWRDFAAGMHRDWDRLYDGFRSAVDFPTAAYWRDLFEHYPDARFILTTRDPDRWYDSATASVLKLLAERDQITDPHHSEILEFSEQIVGQEYFHGRGPDRDYMLDRFRRHETNVRERIPPEQLLVYRVSEGWSRLCSFLDVQIPETPFPFANKLDEYRGAWE